MADIFVNWGGIIRKFAEQTDGVNTWYEEVVGSGGGAGLAAKFAKIAASSSGNNTLVAAVTGKKIRVLGFNFIGNGAVNAKFQDGAGGTDLTGLYYIPAAGGGVSVGYSRAGWFETTAATLLNLNLSGAVAVGGSLVYLEV
jgi:hypothetical protein